MSLLAARRDCFREFPLCVESVIGYVYLLSHRQWTNLETNIET